MPLVNTIITKNNTKILVWKIEEAIEYLHEATLLTSKSLERLSNFKNEIHKKQFLCVRQLLQLNHLTDEDLFYDEVGKPFLKDNKYISISHSSMYVVIALSDKNIGVDIERKNPKISLVQRKFIGDEQSFIEKDLEKEYLSIIWSAKESLYKILGLKGISLKQDIKIHPFKLSDKKTTATIEKDHYKKTFEVHFSKIENYTLVFAMNV